MAMSTAQIPPSGAFSTAGEEAINRTVEIRENELTSTEAEHENIEDLFEIPETVQCIIDKDYRQVRTPPLLINSITDLLWPIRPSLDCAPIP